MHRIATSGGLELGPPDGPWIDIISTGVSYRKVSLELGKQAARWGQWHALGSGQLPPSALPKEGDSEGVVALWQKESLSLRFLHRSGQSPTIALKTVGAAEPHLPSAITAAVLTACRMKDRMTDEASTRHVSEAVRLNADMSAMYTSGSSDYSRKDINHLVEEFLEEIAGGGAIANSSMPEGSVDLARFFILLAKRLWQPSGAICDAHAAARSPYPPRSHDRTPGARCRTKPPGRSSPTHAQFATCRGQGASPWGVIGTAVTRSTARPSRGAHMGSVAICAGFPLIGT
jgi:hypothetical protein